MRIAEHLLLNLGNDNAKMFCLVTGWPFSFNIKELKHKKIYFSLLCHPKQEKTQGHLVLSLDGTWNFDVLGKKVESKVTSHQIMKQLGDV